MRGGGGRLVFRTSSVPFFFEKKETQCGMFAFVFPFHFFLSHQQNTTQHKIDLLVISSKHQNLLIFIITILGEKREKASFDKVHHRV